MSGKSDALRLLNVIEQEATRASDKGEWLNAPWTVSLIREIRTALNGEAAAERERAERLDLEALAAIEHDQWIAWASSIIESEPGLSPERVTRWRSLFVPYSELSEEMKEHDRKWARVARAALSDPVPETLEQKRIRNAPEHSEEGWSR